MISDLTVSMNVHVPYGHGNWTLRFALQTRSTWVVVCRLLGSTMIRQTPAS
jgi:hypothetical protein